MDYRQVQVIGGKGGAAEQFSTTLRAVCTDRRDFLYAAGDSQVKVFDPAGRLARRLNASRPVTAVAVAEDGSVYAGEEGQIEIFDRAGKLSSTWRDGTLLGEVTAIGFAGSGILVADARDRAIRHFDQSRKLLNHIGKDNRMRGFLIPNGAIDFSIDTRQVIHAANPGKHRVERYSLDGKLLGHIGRFDGRDPSGFTGCCNPTNVTVTPDGHLYVTEKAGPRAKLLDAAGGLIAVIATTVFDAGCKNMDIAVCSRGRVYVADTVKLQVLVFAPAGRRDGAEAGA